MTLLAAILTDQSRQRIKDDLAGGSESIASVSSLDKMMEGFAAPRARHEVDLFAPTHIYSGPLSLSLLALRVFLY